MFEYNKCAIPSRQKKYVDFFVYGTINIGISQKKFFCRTKKHKEL